MSDVMGTDEYNEQRNNYSQYVLCFALPMNVGIYFLSMTLIEYAFEDELVRDDFQGMWASTREGDRELTHKL